MAGIGRVLLRIVSLTAGAATLMLAYRLGRSRRPMPRPAPPARPSEKPGIPERVLPVGVAGAPPGDAAAGALAPAEAPSRDSDPALVEEIAAVLEASSQPLGARDISRVLARRHISTPLAVHAVEVILRDHPDRFTHVGSRRYAPAGSPNARRWLVREIFGRDRADER